MPCKIGVIPAYGQWAHDRRMNSISKQIMCHDTVGCSRSDPPWLHGYDMALGGQHLLNEDGHLEQLNLDQWTLFLWFLRDRPVPEAELRRPNEMTESMIIWGDTRPCLHRAHVWVPKESAKRQHTLLSIYKPGLKPMSEANFNTLRPLAMAIVNGDAMMMGYNVRAPEAGHPDDTLMIINMDHKIAVIPQCIAASNLVFTQFEAGLPMEPRIFLDPYGSDGPPGSPWNPDIYDRRTGVQREMISIGATEENADKPAIPIMQVTREDGSTGFLTPESEREVIEEALRSQGAENIRMPEYNPTREEQSVLNQMRQPRKQEVPKGPEHLDPKEQAVYGQFKHGSSILVKDATPQGSASSMDVEPVPPRGVKRRQPSFQTSDEPSALDYRMRVGILNGKMIEAARRFVTTIPTTCVFEERENEDHVITTKQNMQHTPGGVPVGSTYYLKAKEAIQVLENMADEARLTGRMRSWTTVCCVCNEADHKKPFTCMMAKHCISDTSGTKHYLICGHKTCARCATKGPRGMQICMDCTGPVPAEWTTMDETVVPRSGDMFNGEGPSPSLRVTEQAVIKGKEYKRTGFWHSLGSPKAEADPAMAAVAVHCAFDYSV